MKTNNKSNYSITNNLNILLLLTALFLLMVFNGVAQPPVPQAEIERISNLPVVDQERLENQRKMQAWFSYRLSRWIKIADGFAVGSLVHSGDPDALRSRLSLQPGGRPDWRVIWRKQAGGPQKEPGEPFYFPRGQVGSYYDPSDPATIATIWHEAQHGILGSEALLSRPNAVSNYFDPAAPEHLYLESYAQNTVQWLLTLNLGKPAADFEKIVREIAVAEDTYRNRGATITLDVERNLWQPANIAWKRAAQAIKNIAGLADPMRQEYKRLAGVDVPSVEEVVQFYMNGGVKRPIGEKIFVPKWVMVTDPMLATVSIEEKEAANRAVIEGGILRHHFEIRPVYHDYRTNFLHLAMKPTLRGRFTVQFTSNDDYASLAIAIGGRKISGIAGPGGQSTRRFLVDLSVFSAELEKDTYVHVTFIHRHPEHLIGSKSFKIAVNYDDPADAKGVRVFESSAALFWIDVKGTGTVSSRAPDGKAPATSATSKTGVRRMLDVVGFAWASWDRVARFNDVSWGSGWLEWGTHGESLQIPEGGSILVHADAGRYTLTVTGTVDDRVASMRIRGVSRPGSQSYKEEFELELKDVPSVPGQPGDYIAQALPRESVVPRDVNRFVTRATYERTFPDGTKQVLDNADWLHRTGPWATLPESPNAQCSFVSIRITRIGVQGGPAPAEPTVDEASSVLRAQLPTLNPDPSVNPPVSGEMVRITLPPVEKGQPTNLGVGRVWQVTEFHEDTWTATWTLRRDMRTFDGVWTNQRTRGVYKGEARLVSVQGNQVVVRRDALNLEYTGTMAPDGHSIKRGTRNDFTSTQYWTATWD